MKKHYLFGKPERLFVIIALILAIPVLYINLGLMPLIGDESIRALVSLEMMLSGDYLTPTLTGELYFNKPPLYNWIIIVFYKIFNSNSEFVTRLPSTIFLLVYCISIFFWVKSILGKQAGFIASLMFLTCGRILIYDSMLGLIDITYSWIIFTNFMLIWHLFKKQEYGKLFIVSYILTSVAFLMKGLPTLAFQAMTLLALFTLHKKFKVLLSWRHFLGIFIFILLAGVYYYFYYTRHPDAFPVLISKLYSESADKSAVGLPVVETALHIFSFPFEMLYHFAPWTFLIVFMFDRNLLSKALENKFVFFCLITFIANIIIYWLSPVTYPRYLLMLFPLIFIVMLYLAKMHAVIGTWIYRLFKHVVYYASTGVLAAAGLIPLFLAGLIPTEYVILKSLLVILLSTGVLVLYHKKRNTGLFVYMAFALLVARISFNFFILPVRHSESWAVLCRKDSIELAGGTAGSNLFYMTDTITIPNAFYITRERKEILRYRERPGNEDYYIVDDTTLYNGTFVKEFTMRIPMNRGTFYAGKFNLK